MFKLEDLSTKSLARHLHAEINTFNDYLMLHEPNLEIPSDVEDYVIRSMAIELLEELARQNTLLRNSLEQNKIISIIVY